MPRSVIIGLMGPGQSANASIRNNAFEIGKMIATNGWILLTGGRNVGVMNAASQGAKQAGGTTVGILPGSSYHGVSEFVDIPILTGMGSARNNLNVLSSQVLVAVGMGAGTSSEVALAIKAGKPVILFQPSAEEFAFFGRLGPDTIQQVKTIVSLEALIRQKLT